MQQPKVLQQREHKQQKRVQQPKELQQREQRQKQMQYMLLQQTVSKKSEQQHSVQTKLRIKMKTMTTKVQPPRGQEPV